MVIFSKISPPDFRPPQSLDEGNNPFLLYSLWGVCFVFDDASEQSEDEASFLLAALLQSPVSLGNPRGANIPPLRLLSGGDRNLKYLSHAGIFLLLQ